MSIRRNRRTLTRRAAFGYALAGAAGLAASGWNCLPALAAPDAPPTPGAKAPKAKAVIQVWLAGGPCHLDTFDPKPEAGSDYCGPLVSPIETNVSGIRIGEMLPMLAQQADKYALIRSMTHGVQGHETAAYTTQTGRRPGHGESGLVFPAFGAVVAAHKGRAHGYEGVIPPFVVLTRPMGRFAIEGFLGLEQKPFVTGGDPRQPRFAVEGIVQQGVTDERQRARRKLLHDLDALGRALKDDPGFEKLDDCEEQAYDLILGDAGKVFDLSQEKDEVRDRYGRTTLGQSCLAARRLVEEGVPYVAVNSGGWDTHKRHFESMRQKLPDLDRSLSALLEDLAQRGLLDSTIVWCCGEFGRTPKVQYQEPWNGGRGHHGHCYAALVAGGGFRGGQVVGTSDDVGFHVADRPVQPHDLHATMHELLGIDPDGKLANPRGLDATVSPPSETGKGKGRLKEIT